MPPVQKGTEDVLQLPAPEAAQLSTPPDWYFNSYCTGAVLHVPTYLTHRKDNMNLCGSDEVKVSSICDSICLRQISLR